MLRGRKLLLADDSIAIQKVIELTFGDEGMEVVSVGNGQLALARLEEVRPDILLIDVVMPGPSGYEVCERIKQHEQFRHVPVILLVGSFEPFNEAEARRVGADDYLTKPFQSIRQMVSKVGALLGGRKSEEDAATRRLPAQPEQSREQEAARADDLELRTADTAPLPQHIGSENQDESNRQHKRPFADLQLDDEMIEETSAGRFGSAGQTAEIPSHQRPTEPLRPREMAEAGGVNPQASTLGQQAAPTPADAPPAPLEAREVASLSEPTPSTTTTRNAARPAQTSDEHLLDLDDVEMPRTSAMAEADDFILDLQEAAEAQPQAAASSAAAPFAFESAPQIMKMDELEIEAELAEEMTEAAPQAADFAAEQEAEASPQRNEFVFVTEPQATAPDVHFSIPDAPSPAPQSAPEMQQAGADSSQMRDTHELGSDQQAAAPTAHATEGFQPEAAPPSSSAEAAAPAAGAGQGAQSQPGQIGLEQLSPEVIDAIARRVVEQLSKQVIEQIAWEVVPHLSELIIKQRLEEEGRK